MVLARSRFEGAIEADHIAKGVVDRSNRDRRAKPYAEDADAERQKERGSDPHAETRSRS
ncbi:hypothetical protein GCM10007887_06510 [Methylobacterium haplocladii]|uniref:Uncharacterized protein n=1 Tax=Methylobacterium haplocladii TaxID=1176176 RepID=A0A512IQ33_9HYPH|nr:hypothetical protein MHA02_22190 [Methylobacterium haplocladii]GLS57995.1 hypothetical protein GCM10007887_06510 [Methylobacterium haplocladii]